MAKNIWNIEYIDLNESSPRTVYTRTERAATAEAAKQTAFARLTLAGDRPSRVRAWR